MKQKIITPDILPCPICGNMYLRVFEDFDFQSTYRVECPCCHSHLTRYCGSVHRAIHRWNNRVLINKGVL